MGDVVVLGGYGNVGPACVRELIETTQARVVVAGRSVQRAEQAAMALGENVRGVYVDSADERTMRSLAPGALALVCCTGGDLLRPLDFALECRVPFISVTPFAMDTRAAAERARQAWAAQVPVVLGAGAVPGIPGVLAEYLVRRLPEIDRLHVATTGAWRGTQTARQDLAREREGKSQARSSPAGGAPTAPRSWRFPEQIGTWPVRSTVASDLDGFADSHCVGTIQYLEVHAGPLARTAARLLGRAQEPQQFAASAEAWAPNDRRARVEVEAPDVLAAAAVAVGAIVRAVLDGRVPAGLLTQREALNPSVLLDELEKRGFQVRRSPES